MLLQIGFAATVAAFTLVVTVQLSTLREVVLIAAGIFSVVATIFAAAALVQPVRFVDLSPDEAQLRKALAAKRWRCNFALLVLSLTVEVAAGIIACTAA